MAFWSILVLVAFVAACRLSHLVGFENGAQSVRADAVDRRLAEWVPDHEGWCKFGWRRHDDIAAEINAEREGVA